MDWTVAQNNGDNADLEAGPLGTQERKTIRRPNKMNRKEFYDLLRPGNTLSDATLLALFEDYGK
jgi:hypothetical protein